MPALDSSSLRPCSANSAVISKAVASLVRLSDAKKKSGNDLFDRADQLLVQFVLQKVPKKGEGNENFSWNRTN